jgi:hypothetical protein
LLHPVRSDLFVSKDKALNLKEGTTTQTWQWRFDASIALAEMNYNKVTKKLTTTTLSAVGPAIGYQHYVPTSATDPTPFNNYGFGVAVLVGTSIYEPDISSVKIALQANIMQFLKFGATITPKPLQDISPFGFFFGTGITF